MRGPRTIRYVYEDVDRHGNVRIYFWRGRNFRKVRITEKPYSEPFYDRYHALLRLADVGKLAQAKAAGLSKGTYRWLCQEYMKSAVFRQLEPSTQTARRHILEATFDEPIRPDSQKLFGDMPLTSLTTKNLRALRDRKAHLPNAANNRIKAIKAVCKWALEEEHIGLNPARDLSKLKVSRGGHRSWEVDDVAKFEARHPLGSKARLAMALILLTGARRSDAVLLGRQHRRTVWNYETLQNEPWLKFTQQKNRNSNPVVIEIPVLPDLDRVIEASPCGDMTYLVTEQGRPFTVAGFGNWFHDRCVEADVPGRAHGLRKAGAITAAENGATTKQLQAIFGWLTLSEAERYTREAARKRLAGTAMDKMIRRTGP